MNETSTPGPEDQAAEHSGENLEQARRAAVAQELVDLYGDSELAYRQIVSDLRNDPARAEVILIVIDVLARRFLDEARSVVQTWAADRDKMDLMVSKLMSKRKIAFEVAHAAITLALDGDKDHP